jgi:hypothetical protein
MRSWLKSTNPVSENQKTDISLKAIKVFSPKNGNLYKQLPEKGSV